ncbi:MAG: bifunctional oligoribonuclease/PAP phosphatase NrnA [Sulfurovum sp.]|nr:bifunctional oligoribonuclease/PAP phosphatase NrnA [Sulfurovum sp.]
MSLSKATIRNVSEKIEKARTVTILTHLNPDPDTLGTGLGIFALLKTHTSKPIEIVNASVDLPRYLDFLPFFHRIKQKIEFEESLIIGCDCGSIDRFGFDLEGREIINIDHHASNDLYGDVNVVLPEFASASQVAYRLFEKIFSVTPDAATCFYTALLSDTRYFTTSTVNREVFRVAGELVDLGAEPAEIATNFTQRRSLASLRILERALRSLVLYREGKIAVLEITPEDIAASGATMPDMDGIVDYARSLAVVQVAVLLIALPDGTVRVSLRSKGADVSRVAARFGGGGHKVAAGFTLKDKQTQEIVDTILEEISLLGLIDGQT